MSSDGHEQILTEGVENLLKHYSVLSTYIACVISDAERKQFAAWYPRTWNSIQTGDALIFDLPEVDSEQLSEGGE